ncbi:HD domain-containing protein [Vallitalea okinawensis]|uniref:HD domain-containing protein n=1 Tax=Vallitalea okinawensis TaxID=2078660 RepID=UPI000CFD92A0|nr:HD domain-containing protein [Vallitalea okinawensis]
MDRGKYQVIEDYMLSSMDNNDTAHGYQHVYRVLYNALEISKDYELDDEVLIVSSLLHDIGRDAQTKNSYIDHAEEGAEKAYLYLISNGWSKGKANHIKDCISTHSNRNACSIEAKIIFDADKLDVIGAIGVARIIAYNGIVSQPLYSVSNNGMVLPGEKNEKDSFFKEYNNNFKKIYDRFYTKKAKEMAKNKKKTSEDYYNKLFEEVYNIHKNGIENLNIVLKA